MTEVLCPTCNNYWWDAALNDEDWDDHCPECRAMFNLSDEAIAILKLKSEEFHISEGEMLEALICELRPSTEEERVEQRTNRKLAFSKYLDYLIDDIQPDQAWRIWQKGFNAGWVQFQTRKKSSIFNLKAKLFSE